MIALNDIKKIAASNATEYEKPNKNIETKEQNTDNKEKFAKKTAGKLKTNKERKETNEERKHKKIGNLIHLQATKTSHFKRSLHKLRSGKLVAKLIELKTNKERKVTITIEIQRKNIKQDE